MSVNDLLRAAYAAYSKGDLASARSHGAAALKAAPDEPVVLQLMGVISCQSGDLDRGIGYLRKVIDLGEDNADTRINLVRALIDAGRLEEAAALTTGPIAAASPDLQRAHADILKRQGRTDESIWAYEDLVAVNPDDADAWNNLGNARHAHGDLEGAMSALDKARALNEHSPQIHVNIARVLISQDRYEEACLMLEKAVLLNPSDPAPLLELGRTLSQIDHAEAGLRALGSAARLDPRNPVTFVSIAMAFNDLSNLDQAEKSLRMAIHVDRTHAPAYLNLGILLEKSNRVEELNTLIAEAEAAGVSGTEIDYLRALSLSRSGNLEAAYDLAKAVHTSAISAAMQAQFVGQLADRLGRIDDAFAVYEDMNRAMAQSPLGLGKDRAAYRLGIDAMAREATPQWFAGWPKVAPVAEPPAPAFLVGFPRSGTTLLDTILMGHSRTHVLEELPIIETIANELGGQSALAKLDDAGVQTLRSRYFAELDAMSPPPAGALIIDKNPLSMIRLPLIYRLFPDAKIILAMRHPCDVVLSCYMQNFKPTEAMSSFLDLSNASHTYDRIFNLWEVSTAGLPIDTHMIRYEDMVDDVAAAIRPLFAFLGLEWEEQALDHTATAIARGHIRTPSYAQVTEKIYTSASGRWARYRRYMEDVLPILKPWVDRFGYRLD